MDRDIRKRYGFASWSRRLRREGSLLLRGFAPWPEDCQNWRRESKQALLERRGQRLLRTVWAAPRAGEKRVLVDVRETASSARARAVLLDVLANNQLARLPEGPDDLGDVSFVHPEGVPPAVFWVTGNVCVSAVSIGPAPVLVVEWGYRLHARMVEMPKVEGAQLALTTKRRHILVKEDQPLHFAVPETVSEDGYCKFLATGGELLLKEGELYVRALQRGPVTVEAVLVEPGRPPAGGRLQLSAS